MRAPGIIVSPLAADLRVLGGRQTKAEWLNGSC